MFEDKKTILLAVLAVAAAAVLYYSYYSKSSTTQKEGFLSAGQMTHLGAIVPDGIMGNYELIEGGHQMPLNNVLRATDFAELVDGGDQAVQSLQGGPRPLERLQDLSDSYFPTVATKALPFSQAAAKPLYHSHAVNLPRVNLKGKLYEMNIAEAVRGTVPINYDPNVSLVASSKYRNEDVFNPGFMTTAYNSLYNKLTGSHKNLPMYIEGAGTASGVGGMGVEAIYDA